jgi:hypothetical protein
MGDGRFGLTFSDLDVMQFVRSKPSSHIAQSGLDERTEHAIENVEKTYP